MTTVTARPSSTRGRLPAARHDRRPALAALAVLLILVGALGSALLAFRSGSRVDVLVARTDIALGQVIGREDLTTARVAADGVATLPADALETLVGDHARVAVPAGTLLHDAMVEGSEIMPDGAQVVGIVLDANRRTTRRPAVGEVVQVVYVAGANAAAYRSLSPGDPVVPAARVTDVGSGGAGTVSVSVLVPDDEAGTVADLAAAGSLALTLLPPSTRPVVDWSTAEGD